MQRKFFIGGINSFLCANIVETLRNDHENDENPHSFYGTKSITQDPQNLPNGANGFSDVLFSKIVTSGKRHKGVCKESPRIRLYNLFSRFLSIR